MNKEKDYKIILLQNAFHYGLQCVFIKVSEEDCRLIVIHNNRLLHDQSYPTLRGAKIAFTKIYRYRRFSKGRADWTGSYRPESDWLEPKMEIVEKGMD